MKGMDIFCTSQAATAICLSMEHPSSSSASASASPSPSLSSTILLGSSSPAIDRHNPIIRDSRRSAAANPLAHKKKLPPKQNEKEMVNKNIVNGRKSWSCTKAGEFISPPGSTRYLLNGLSDLAETSNSKEAEADAAAVDQVRVNICIYACKLTILLSVDRI